MDARVKRKEAYEGPCYIFDHSKIKIGDVLLSTTDAGLSLFIRGMTRSDFSHAAIFVQDGGVVIEAVFPNVKVTSVLGLAIRDRKTVKVLRWAGSELAFDAQAIANFARSHVFKGYSRVGAVLTKFPEVFGSPEETELFCSQLIASSYLSCGVSLTDKAPEKTTPADIANSANMIDITDDVLERIDSGHLLFERFVEQGSVNDLSAVFHSTIKLIVDATIRACPFVKGLGIKSLEEVIVALVLGDKFFSPDQIKSLAQQFSLAVDDKLDRLIEQLLEAHSESFVQHEIVRLLIENNWATDDQLRHHLKFLEASSVQTERSLDLRMKNIEEAAMLLKSAPPCIDNLPVIKTIQRFYNNLFTIEQDMFNACNLAKGMLRSYLDTLSA